MQVTIPILLLFFMNSIQIHDQTAVNHSFEFVSVIKYLGKKYLITYLLKYLLAYLLTYLLTYLLQGKESFLKS